MKLQENLLNSVLQLKKGFYRHIEPSDNLTKLENNPYISKQDLKICLEDIRKTINHVQGRNEAKKFLSSLDRIADLDTTLSI